MQLEDTENPEAAVDTTYVEIAFEVELDLRQAQVMSEVAAEYAVSPFGAATWSDHDIPCGILQLGYRGLGPLDEALAGVGASFRAWEAPRYESRGSISLWSPALGFWRGECDSFGLAILVEGRLPAELVGVVGDLLPTRWESTNGT